MDFNHLKFKFLKDPQIEPVIEEEQIENIEDEEAKDATIELVGDDYDRGENEMKKENENVGFKRNNFYLKNKRVASNCKSAFLLIYF